MPSVGGDEDLGEETQEVEEMGRRSGGSEGGSKVSVPLCGRVRRCVN